MSPGTAPVATPGAVLPDRKHTVDPHHQPPELWLWGDRHGAISCGAASCSLPRRDYRVLTPVELAELGALAMAHRTTLRCRCGAAEYDPASRTVRERIERTEP